MKNFKQLIPALILGVFVMGGFVFATNQTTNSCTPPGCFEQDPVDVSQSQQTKAGGFTASYIGGWGSVQAQNRLIVGANINNDPVSSYVTGSLRSLYPAWFKDSVYIAENDNSNITDNFTKPNAPKYNLELKGGSTTNLGMGNTCTISASQSVINGCPSGTFVSNYNASATGAGIAVTCTAINPSANPTNTGSCYSSGAPTYTGSAVTHTAYNKSSAGQPDACAISDVYTIAATFATDTETPLTYAWRYKDHNATSFTNINNSNSPSISVTVDRWGWNTNNPNGPATKWDYQVKMTDSLNRTTGWVDPTNYINSLYRPSTYTDSNNNTYTCS